MSETYDDIAGTSCNGKPALAGTSCNGKIRVTFPGRTKTQNTCANTSRV